MSDDEHQDPQRPPSLPAPISELGYNQANEIAENNRNEQWRQMFDLQSSQMRALIQAIKSPISSKPVTIPEFNPDKRDSNARSWCATADLCFNDNPATATGGHLIVTLSKALKGVASTWLAQISYPGITWDEFKELFKARFVTVETNAATLINLNNEKPHDNETYSAFASRLISSLMSRWNNATIELVAVSIVLSHLAQIDSRLNRLAFTRDVTTSAELQKELQAYAYLKRKAPTETTAPGPQDHSKRPKIMQQSKIKCFLCDKVGHKQADCRMKGSYPKKQPAPASQSSQQQPQASSSRAVICFRCGQPGHIATRCPTPASASAPTPERRVDLCVVEPPSGKLIHRDCLHLQLYRDPKDRYKKGQTKASLSLQHFLGFESGFTLDKESNTIAIICQDVTVVLAFETRERLISWQVKVGGQLGPSAQFLVLVGGGARRLAAGPARLHLQGGRFALASGVPPRLVGLWELKHLRRYGVVEGRFCFEGGSHCGKGEGLHVLITDQAQDITDAFDQAAHGNRSLGRPGTSRMSAGNNNMRPDTRLSDNNTADQSRPNTASGLYEENFFNDDCEGISPFWPSDERRAYDEPDTARANHIGDIGTKPAWNGADQVTLERCNNCLTKLGAITRSSTVSLTPGATFNPAWTMEAVPETKSDSNSSNDTEYLTPRAVRKLLNTCHCKDRPPQRPPKPSYLEQKKLPAPLPAHSCGFTTNDNSCIGNNSRVGPYENYDVPKAAHAEVDNGEYYDTPKRIKQSMADDLFRVTNADPEALVLKKNCGCILKFGSKKKPVIVECDENLQPVECPCQKVTNWANNLISLPYCKRNELAINTKANSSDNEALYATVDVTRKTNRQSGTVSEKEALLSVAPDTLTNYENIEPKSEKDYEGPYANYENLEFALSLEYYENAKDLLKKAGVTQTELDALSANVAHTSQTKKGQVCSKCVHCLNNQQCLKKNKSDEYLLMEPTADTKNTCSQIIAPNPGYTPMSPNPNWSLSLRQPIQKIHHIDIEKSVSNPVLNENILSFSCATTSTYNKDAMQKRSSSVDSARLLEDLKELDSSVGSHATSSSLETLRNIAINTRRSSTPCQDEGRCNQHCCKSSGSENKTSETDSTKELPHLRNKLIDNAEIKRSSSVPCKSGGNRDSSSSNDSGVSSCSMKHGVGDFQDFEMPLTSGQSRHQYMVHRRLRGNLTGCLHSSLPRKSKSSDLLKDVSMQLHKAYVPAKSSSAEAEVPVLPPKHMKGVVDTHSTSSGTSDMSDYIETLSLSSSHSSSDAGLRINRQPTSTLRPRSGKEYHNLDPIITSMYKSGKDLANYTNIP